MNDKEDEYSHEASWGKVLLAGYAGYELCVPWSYVSVLSDKVVIFSLYRWTSGQIPSLKLT